MGRTGCLGRGSRWAEAKVMMESLNVGLIQKMNVSDTGVCMHM